MHLDGASAPGPAVPAAVRWSWLASRGRRTRLRRYARAMGWDLTTTGVLVGDVEGVAVRVTEDRGRAAVLELVAPGVLPRMETVLAAVHVAQVSDGMRDVHVGDAHFESVYVVRAAEPWMARAVFDETVRRALLAAPRQTWTTRDDRLVARTDGPVEPLDLFARATALRTVIAAVPWDAYEDRRTPPSMERVQAVVAERRSRPVEILPSMPRRA